MLYYILIFLIASFILGICIFVHELGHFLAAKWRGLHVSSFSIGFKKIYSFRYKDTEYIIGCLPFGGYVEIPQFESNNPEQNLKQYEQVATSIDKIIIAIAGPFFNILFGLLLATIIYWHGIPQSINYIDSIKVTNIIQDSPEYLSGLRKGDLILKLNGKKINGTWEKFVQDIIFTNGDVNLTVISSDEKFEKIIKYRSKINYYHNNKIFIKEGLPYPFFGPEIPVILQVDDLSNLYKYGLRTNDILVKIDNEKIDNLSEYINYISNNEREYFDLVVIRNKQEMNFTNVKLDYVEKKNINSIGIIIKEEDGIKIENVITNDIKLFPNDSILKLNGIAVDNCDDVSTILHNNTSDSLVFLINRNNEELQITIPVKIERKRIPKNIKLYSINHINPIDQFVNFAIMSYKSIKNLFYSDSNLKVKHMSGPVGIFNIIMNAIYSGSFMYLINIIMLITFSLGLLNLLPIPILDGSIVIISLIEMIIGRNISYNFIKYLFILFMFLLIGLMCLFTFNDIAKIFFHSKIITYLNI